MRSSERYVRCGIHQYMTPEVSCVFHLAWGVKDAIFVVLGGLAYATIQTSM